jgi:hypothetical protein
MADETMTADQVHAYAAHLRKVGLTPEPNPRAWARARKARAEYARRVIKKWQDEASRRVLEGGNSSKLISTEDRSNEEEQ